MVFKPLAFRRSRTFANASFSSVRRDQMVTLFFSHSQSRLLSGERVDMLAVDSEAPEE